MDREDFTDMRPEEATRLQAAEGRKEQMLTTLSSAPVVRRKRNVSGSCRGHGVKKEMLR